MTHHKFSSSVPGVRIEGDTLRKTYNNTSAVDRHDADVLLGLQQVPGYEFMGGEEKDVGVCDRVDE